MKKNSLTRTHGWDVELTCSGCSSTAMPRYEGWSPNLQTNAGPGVAVYAKVACAKCGRRLTDEAGRKLVELFRDRDIPDRNKRILGRFIARLFLVPAVLTFALFFGMQMDWWGWGLGTIWILAASAVSIPLFLVLKKKELGALASGCECGKPHTIFMGAVDGALCYRCYSCGRLQKVRE